MAHIRTDSTQHCYFRPAQLSAAPERPHAVKRQESKAPDASQVSQSLDFINRTKAKFEEASEPSTKKGVSEQDVFASLAHSKLSAKGPDAAKRFESEFEKNMERFTGEKDQVFLATDKTLSNLLRDGVINQSEYQAIKSEAFGKAQLDGDRNTLGSEPVMSSKTGNPLSFEELMAWLTANPDATPEEMSSFLASQKPAGGKVDAAGAAQGAGKTGASGASGDFGPPSNTFLWKPASDKNGKLAILLPANMAGQASSVKVLSPDGRTTLATGSYAGVGNGSRTHFRFDKPGSAFPNGSVVQITMKDGSTQNIQVANTAARLEKKF